MTTTTTTQHGGPRPAIRPDDARRHNRGPGPGKAGPARQRISVADLLPGADLSEPTISAADITIWRCQACGTVWWDRYSEGVYVLADGPAVAEVQHAERAPRHRPGCAMGK